MTKQTTSATFVLFFCLLAFTFNAKSQNYTFQKSLYCTDKDFTSVLTSGKGWLLFSQDSGKVFKFNSCGNLEWAKRYFLPNSQSVLICPIKTKAGGFAFNLAEYNLQTGIWTSTLVSIDAQGNKIWSHLIQDTSFVLLDTPYSLVQDKAGSFYLFQYIQNTTVFGNHHNCGITKISESGNIIWSKYYLPCDNDGDLTITSDNKLLMRSGNTIVKLDTSGTVIWSTILKGALNYNYWFSAPVEVDDGYIFNGLLNPNVGGGNIIFNKLDTNGILLWGGGKKINFSFINSWEPIFQKYNGNFIFIHAQNIGGGEIYSTWTEFDKELNVVNQSAVKSMVDIANYGLAFPSEISFFSDSTAIMSGFAAKSQTSNIAHLSFLKVDKNQHYSCDTSLQITSTLVGIPQFNVSIFDLPRSLISIERTIQISPIYDSTFIGCSSFPKMYLDLGRDTQICAGLNVTLKNKTQDAFDEFLWSTGEKTTEITVSESGKYWLRATNACSRISESDTIEILVYSENCEELMMPNIFTPNGDNLNNLFQPIKSNGINSASLKVFNRWGTQVYSTTEYLTSPWNGKFQNQICPDGLYLWMIEYTNYLNIPRIQKGTVTLLGN